MTSTTTPDQTPTVIEPRDADHWHSLRTEDVTSTQSPALLGASPYLTALQLYLEKTGKAAPAFTENERAFWGRTLEPAVAEGLAQRHGLTVRPITAYMRHPAVAGMGASFDYEIVAADPLAAASESVGTASTIARLVEQHGPGILELKTVDYLQFRDTWDDQGDDNLEAPPHIELQLQHQLAVAGRAWGAFGVLVAGNRGLLIPRERHAGAIAALEDAVAAFWRRVAAGDPPPVDGARDVQTITQLYPRSDPAAELPEDLAQEAAALCAEIKAHEAEQKAAEEAMNARKARLKVLLADAEMARVPGYTITYKSQVRKAHTREVPESTTRPLRIKPRAASDTAQAA